MKKYFNFIAVFILFSMIIKAQGIAGEDAKYEYRSLLDMPTAGILQKGFVGVSVNSMPEGVLISKLEVGVFENFCFGFSFGGSNIIGTGDIEWYKLPALNARFRVLNETEKIPAFTIGFDSQGKGKYYEDENRYQIKSPGFFLAASKTFEFLGYLSIHATANKSLEGDDGDKDFNFSVGLEKTIQDKISLVAEYDFAVNDNDSTSIGDGNGYLNVGVRMSVGDGFTIGLDLRDLLENKKINSFAADRAIYIEYIQPIF